jgi:tetratricopeptide (TPR) repeat protein
LGVLGEVAWPVPGMRRDDAVRLFLDRADVTAVRALTDADGPGIAALCARLDGLPLAIELAAARTAVLSVAEITDRLHDPALLCTARHPDRPQHRAMHATIAWSYDLLDAATRDRFRRLAVFAGGFTLDAAETVWPGGPAAMDVLTDLAAKSLVVVERNGSCARYRLLETIGRWATARLAECPEAERDARARHAAHYLALAEKADRGLGQSDAELWLARLAADHENLRAALAWFAGGGRDPIARLRLAVALAKYCQLRGRYLEGRQWLESALGDCVGAAAELVGRALSDTACFALLTCDYGEAQRVGERALEAWRRIDDPRGTARMLKMLSSIARERGEYVRALDLLDEAMGFIDPDDALGRACVLHQTGFICWLSGDLDRARGVLAAALRVCRSLGDRVTEASLLIDLGMVAVHCGELEVADRLSLDALARCRELDIKEGIAWAWHLIGLVALRRGCPESAVAALRSSLEIHHEIGDRWRQASVLDSLAEALLEADPVRAAELSGLADGIRDVLGVPVPVQERAGRERTHEVLGRVVPGYRAVMARGGGMRVAEVLMVG